jgi:hypothetical protein
MPDRTKVSRSQLLHTPKFAGLADEYISRNDTVIDAIDASVEIFDGMKMKRHFGMAVVLTTRQLMAFRSRGMLGGRAPLTVDITSIGEVGVTRQGNVSIEFRDAYGTPGLWKLVLSDLTVADRWMQQISDQTQPQPEGKDRHGDPSPEWKECRKRLQAFCHALSPLTQAAMIGQPFAEGLGLEQAMKLVPRYFLNATDVREADKIISIDLIAETGRQRMMPDDLDTVMGVTENALQKSLLAPAELSLVESLAGAAKTFLGQFDEDGGNMWDLWNNRDDVAAEFLCWHTVARLRLATAGLLSLVEPV